MSSSQWASYLTYGLNPPARSNAINSSSSNTSSSSASATSRVILPQDMLPSHYDLELVPDLTTLTFSATVAISVTVTNKTNSVTLHAKELVIESASISESSSLVEINYHLVDKTVKLVFDGDVLPGEAVLTIKYSGILNGDMAGFYKSGYTDADGKKKTMANTQFEALDARRGTFLQS
jgi:aminopeptidase N